MKWHVLHDFQHHQDVPAECINTYEKVIPLELMEIWKTYGFGSFMNGYLKLINPDDYVTLIKDSYFRANIAVPIMATAFGDVITWEAGQHITFVMYRYGTFNIAVRDFDLFLELLEEPTFLQRTLHLNSYSEAIAKHGVLEYDQCFGYVPLLGLGGKETVENLKKVKTREHIAVIIDMVGGI